MFEIFKMNYAKDRPFIGVTNVSGGHSQITCDERELGVYLTTDIMSHFCDVTPLKSELVI